MVIVMEAMARSVERRRSGDVARSLRTRIERDEYATGAFLPTERELQSEFGASRSTIRRALAQVVEEGFARAVPNRGVVAARPAPLPATNRVCILEGGMFVTRALTVRLGEILGTRGFALEHPVCTPSTSIEDALARAADDGFAGVIVWPFRAFLDVEAIRRVAARLPIVALEHALGESCTDLLTFDHHDAGYRATKHLIAQGRRRIGITGMFDMEPASHSRFCGYLRALFEAGLQPDPTLFAFNKTSGMDSPNPLAVHAVLTGDAPPDAFVVTHDECAPAVVSTALKLGLRVPADLALAGMTDDVDVKVDGLGLTSVAQDWEAMVVRAGELLSERLADPTLPPRTELLPQRLVVRGLCGAPAAERDVEPHPLTDFFGDPRFVRSRYHYSSLFRPS